MFRFLKGIICKDETPLPSNKSSGSKDIIQKSAESSDNSKDYFVTLGRLQEAISTRNYEDAARLARENMHQILTFVQDTKRQFGSFDISSIPALEHGGTMLALAGDDNALKEMREIVSSIPELGHWIPFVNRNEERRRSRW